MYMYLPVTQHEKEFVIALANARLIEKGEQQTSRRALLHKETF